MLDRDLAELYGVETVLLKRAVRRNRDRFPNDFMFELLKSELDDLRCQFGTSRWGGTRYSPFAFPEVPKVGTTQQQISRLESPSYEGHSLSMLRRVAEVLGAKVYVHIQRNRSTGEAAVAESKARYGNKT